MFAIYESQEIISWLNNIKKVPQHDNQPYIKINYDVWLKTVQFHMKKYISDNDMDNLKSQMYHLKNTMNDIEKYLFHYSLLKINHLGIYESYNLIIYNVINFKGGNKNNIFDVYMNTKPNYIQWA